MKGLLLEPMDTLFFRDGTPFASGSASQDEVGGLFPPYPLTVTGALRAALARCNGWNGQGRWPEELDAVLGNGPEDLGRLSVVGPFLVRDGEPLFRMPRHVLGTGNEGKWRPRTLLRPGAPVTCDLGGSVRLPETPGGGSAEDALEPAEGAWVTRAALSAVLRGALPSEGEMLRSEELWAEERRIGIMRDRDTRTAGEGMLYSSRHVRLGKGVALGVGVEGVPSEWKLPVGEAILLGGENRTVECRSWDGLPGLNETVFEIGDRKRVTLIALTPLDLAPDVYRGGAPITDPGPLRVVSACLDRPRRIGGWNTLARRPMPLRSVLPAGSVLFCEIEDVQGFRRAVETVSGPLRIGARRRWGFGAVALGIWPDESEV